MCFQEFVVYKIYIRIYECVAICVLKSLWYIKYIIRIYECVAICVLKSLWYMSYIIRQTTIVV
jgi:hypothetical protein